MKSRYDGLDIYNVIAPDGQVRRCIATRFIDRTPPDNDSKIHVVKDGENLFDLADEYYGDLTLWYIIAEKNPGVSDPFGLSVGQELVIPML